MGTQVTRRTLMASAGGVGAISTADSAGAVQAELSKVKAIFTEYDRFGCKASGGAGDLACGDWLETTLRRSGFETERQPIETPFFVSAAASLATGDCRATVIPQAIVTPTSAGGLTGPLVIWDGEPREAMRGAIVLIALPYGRWSTFKAPSIAKPTAAAFTAGAAAVIVVTTGPTGEALALNAPVAAKIAPGPAAVLAPKDAAPFLDAARHGRPGRLLMTGNAGTRRSFNLVARKPTGSSRTVVVSTPRSGWFGCMGERGPGVAAWLLLAERFALRPPNADLLFLSTSGHEYENAGGALFLKERAPAPDRTVLWLHLGANVAARDWHELGAALAPLPSADPQRFLVATPTVLPHARTAFAGLAGLEAAYPASPGAAAGEATEILAAGYTNVAAIFGAHRYHHSGADDLRCVEPKLVLPVVDAAEHLVRAMVV